MYLKKTLVILSLVAFIPKIHLVFLDLRRGSPIFTRKYLFPNNDISLSSCIKYPQRVHPHDTLPPN
jgi:hypothetical protein